MLGGSSVDADALLDGYIQYSIDAVRVGVDMQCWMELAYMKCWLVPVFYGCSIGMNVVFAGWMQSYHTVLDGCNVRVYKMFGGCNLGET